jgi:RND family efflux transporter MFP subunit
METETRPAGSLTIVRQGGAPARIPERKPVRRRVSTFVLASALGVALALGGVWRFYLQPVSVVAVHPTRGPAIEAVYATGVIEAIDYARFGATVAGRVTDVLVDEGDAVRKGDVVVRLDDSQAEARVRDARARLKMAEADIARDQALMNRGVLAVQTLERAQQERDQAAAAVELFARQLEDYTVLSPLQGTVMKRNVEPGETIAANAVLIEIASTARKRIAAEVDERDIAGVRLGAPIAAHADGFPDETFEARVTNIRREGDSGSRTFRVEADLPADAKLMIGMTVDVDVVVNEKPDALLLPAGAIAHGPSQGGRPGAPFVFVVDDGRARRVDVRTGAVGTAKIEIVSGLKDGDSVVVDPTDRIRAGQAVRVSP